MSDLLNATLGAVGAAGEAVDKVTGGRALRGVLAGKPRELASVIPFSDTMGLTNKADSTSGRDLTDHYNLTTKGDDSFGSHAAGLAADMVASPLSLIGGYGAFKAAPTIAKGIVGAGKAISGLDMVEHAGGALKRFAGYGGAADDAVKAAKMIPPKPVNTAKLAEESLSANATRPRRWSADPAEAAYYSGDRGRRYGQRMSGREIPNPAGGPTGIPEFSLHDATIGGGDDILKPARNKPDTYGFAKPAAARQAMAEAAPTNHGPFVEPTSSAGYKLKSGPIAGGPKLSGVPNRGAVLPAHEPDADLVSAYEKMTAGFPKEAPPASYSIPDEVRAMPNEFRSLGEAKSIADKSALDNAPKPGLLDKIRGMFGTGADDVIKPARMAPKPTGPADSLLQHQPWAGRTDITPTTRNAAEWAGPGYGGGRDKMSGIMEQGMDKALSTHFDDLRDGLMGHPGLEKIASEFPEDTRFLGHGAEALAGISGDGHVIRVAPAQSWLGSSGRADIPHIIQPFRSIQIPGNKAKGVSPWVVEHLPKVNPLYPDSTQPARVRELMARLQGARNFEGVDHAKEALGAMSRNAGDSGGIGYDLSQALKRSNPGLDPWDFNARNISLTNEGNAIGHDGGMVRKWDTKDLITRHSARPATAQAIAKASGLGGQDAVREAMAAGLGRGTVGQGVGREAGIIGLQEAAQRQGVIRSFFDKYGPMLNDTPASLPGATFQSAPNALAQEMARMPVAPVSESGVTRPFAIHVAGQDKVAPGLLSRLLGGGDVARSPMAQAAANGVELPWQRATRIGNEAGFPTTKIDAGQAKRIAKSQGWSPDDLSKTPAWYSANRRQIEINPMDKNWHDNDLMKAYMNQAGPDDLNWFSSSHPDHVINHEIGHGMHADSVGVDRFKHDPELNTPFTPGSNEHNFFQNTLSEYGASRPDEALAEIVAALKGGRELNPSLTPALKEWGGPQMFQNLGDQGLLKGLGLSLLGTLGVGGAATQQQGA